MNCHCGTYNRAQRWTFTDPCKPEVRPIAREESVSPAWLAASAMNARDTTEGIYGSSTLGVDRHYIGSVTATTHQEKGVITLESNPSRGTVLPAPHSKGNKCDKNVKYKRTDALPLWHQQRNTTLDIQGPLQTRGETSCPEESVSPAWLAAPAMNARDTTKGIYGSFTLDVDRHYIGSGRATTHQEKGILTLESNPSRGTVLPTPHMFKTCSKAWLRLI